MKKLLRSLFILLFVAGTAMAQERTITGTVTDSGDGKPLPGVTIKFKGAQGGTQTSSDGRYSVKVPKGVNTLEFTYLGYVSESKNINASVINIALESDSKALTEVVVTGYGKIDRKTFTGAAATVTAAQIANKPVQSFGQSLAGQATGVSIVQPNGLLNNPPVIRVRGLSSLSLSSFPLVVVDGIPISTSDASANSVANNPLGDINPEDIESIDILKDAASTAIYGSRGAAGVLIITTKKGKIGKTKVNYDGWVGVSNAVRLPKVLNAQEYIDFKNQAVANLLAINPLGIPAAQRDASGKSFFPTVNADGSNVDTDWYDVVYRTAYTQNHNVNLSGANEKTSYFVSGGISNQNGFLRANSFKRNTGRANLTHQATDYLKLNMNMAYTNGLNAAPNSGSVDGAAFNSSGLGRIAVALSPNLRPYNPDGSYSLNASNGTVFNENNLIPTSWSNPAVIIAKDRNTSEVTRFIANLGAELKITKELLFKSSYSWDRSNTENIQFWNPFSGDGKSRNGYAYNNNNRRNNWNWINTLNLTKTFGELHNLNVIVGNEVQKTSVYDWGAVRENLSDPFYTQFQGQFITNTAGGNGISAIGLESYLAMLNYNYDGKYFLSGNFRRDGNSGLASGKQWGNFGGGSVGWLISKEDFFANSSLGSFVNNLRLRASYGVVGNGAVGAYKAYSTFSPGLYGEAGTAFLFNRAGNTDLTWETSKQTDIGLNIGLFDNRLMIEADYFNKNIDGMILSVPQAPSKGIPNTPQGEILANVGSMYNRGVELGITAAVFRDSKVKWTSTLNFTSIKNRVTALDPNVQKVTAITSGLETTNITMVGYSAASIYGVKTNGVNPANGRRIFVDLNGREIQYEHLGSRYTYVDDGKTAPAPTDQQQILGNTLPTWYGGFNNNLSYGNFDLGINFTFSGGNYIYNGSRAGLLDQRFWNNSVDVLNAWSSPGQNAEIPKPIYGDNVSNGSSYLISANVEKGDFLRLQTATLGYTLPSTLFTGSGLLGKSGISRIRVYGQVNNAFIITGYTGVDPEISTNGNQNLSSGVERNSIPQGRVFTFGLSVGL